MFAALLFLLLLNFTQMVKPSILTNSSSSNITSSSSIQTRNSVTFQTTQNGTYLLKSVIFGSNITAAHIKFVNSMFDFDVKWLDETHENEEWELSLGQNCNFTLSSCTQCVIMVKVYGDNVEYGQYPTDVTKDCDFPSGGYSMNAKSSNQTSNSQLIAEFDYVPFKFIEDDDDASSSTTPHSTTSPSRLQSTTVTSPSLGLGEIIAIVAGCLLVFIIVIGIIIFICCRKRRKAKVKNQKPKQPGSENPHQQVPPNEIGARANIVPEKKQQQPSEFEEKTCQEPQTMDGGGGEKVIHPPAATAAAAHPKKSPLVKTSDEHLKSLFPDPIEYLAAKAGSVSERQIISGPLDDAEIVISSKLPSKEVMKSSKKQPFLPSNEKNKK